MFTVAIVSICHTNSRSDFNKSKVRLLALPLPTAEPGLPVPPLSSSLPSPGLPVEDASIKDLIGRFARETTSNKVATVE